MSQTRALTLHDQTRSIAYGADQRPSIAPGNSRDRAVGLDRMVVACEAPDRSPGQGRLTGDGAGSAAQQESQRYRAQRFGSDRF